MRKIVIAICLFLTLNSVAWARPPEMICPDWAEGICFQKDSPEYFFANQIHQIRLDLEEIKGWLETPDKGILMETDMGRFIITEDGEIILQE